MGRIDGEILIGRAVDVVFDFVADQRNETQYNPRMVRADKITGGPVGKGTVLRSATTSMGRTADMRIELTGYDRPARLASSTTMSQADMAGTLTFEPVPAGTRMHWTWDVRPKGAFRLLAPLIGWLGRRQERAIWTGMKRYLETPPALP
jgi:Polyketide cyclase / dehydrase and lipid transport